MLIPTLQVVSLSPLLTCTSASFVDLKQNPKREVVEAHTQGGSRVCICVLLLSKERRLLVLLKGFTLFTKTKWLGLNGFT